MESIYSEGGMVTIEHEQNRIGKQYEDSFWYDGLIATVKKNNRTVFVYAEGDVLIALEDRTIREPGDLTQEEYELGDQFLWDVDPEDWRNNNWFSIDTQLDGRWVDPGDLDIFYSYTDALKAAKELVEDDIWWEYDEQEAISDAIDSEV